MLGLLAILAVSWRVSQTRSLSLRFVDEEDHIAFSYYMNRGYRLHEQLQNNHQPLVYFASAAIQKFTHPDNIFMLVRRHRQAMFLYGAVWSLLFVLRFKQAGLIFVLFYEFLKYYLLGNLLLLDSLAAYPTAYLFMTAIEIWYHRYAPKVFEMIWLGIITWLITFTMIPLWPWLAFIWLGILIKLGKKVMWPIVIFGVLTVILFSFYSPVSWWHETVYNNIKYAIPALNEIRTIWDKLIIDLFPFRAFFDLMSLQSQFVAMFFSGWLVVVFFNKRWLLLYPALFLANTRVKSTGATYYEGFHLLPWLGLLTVMFIATWKENRFKRYFVLALLILMLNPAMPYFLKTDISQEYFINYSYHDDFNFAIRNISKPTDRLAVTDNKPLLYWRTGTRPATRQLVYYAWEPNVPELRAGYEQVFYGDNPPEIIYGDREHNLEAEKYVNIQRFGKPTLLFVRADRYAEITDAQWAALATRGFNK